MAAPGDASGLGRLIVKKWWLGGHGALLAGVSAVFGLFAWIEISDSKIREPLRTGLGVAILLAFLGIIYRLAVRRFCVYARGVVKRGLLHTAELRDDEIAGLRYNATRYYVNGAYQGLLFDITVVPDPSTRKKAVGFRALLGSVQEEELDEFRDRVARRLASTMIEVVRRGCDCAWCPQLVVGPEGMRVRPRKVFGHGTEVFVLYADVAELQLQLGRCNVILRSTGQAAASVEQSELNFWPAYFAVCTLAEERWASLEGHS